MSFFQPSVRNPACLHSLLVTSEILYLDLWHMIFWQKDGIQSGTLGDLPTCSLAPSPLPDFIFKTDFSPQLGNKICDWPGDEAMNCPRTCPNKLTVSEGLIRLHLDSTLLCALETSEQVFVLLLVVPSGGRSLGLSGISPLIGGSHGNTLWTSCLVFCWVIFLQVNTNWIITCMTSS